MALTRFVLDIGTAEFADAATALGRTLGETDGITHSSRRFLQVSFIFHVFPLPYHTYAFLAAQGAQVVKSLNGTDAAVYDYINLIFTVSGKGRAASEALTVINWRTYQCV